MKDFAPSVVFAILSEMFGPELWVLAGIVGFVLILGVVFALQRRQLMGDRLRIAIAIAVIAGLVAAFVAPALTHAGFTNIHGLLDWAALVLIAAAGFVSTLWMAYLGLSRRV